MPRQPKSDLVELLKLLRRIVVVAVAVWGLARGVPYVPLAIRLAILWAILYVCSGAVDVAFRRLSYRATLREQGRSAAVEPTASLSTVNAGRAK